jgi:hypothetical protein
MNKQLLILDINGILCRKLALNAEVKGSCYTLRSYKIQARPKVREFLLECLSRYDVGIYTSTTANNADSILKSILGPKIVDRFKFVWYRPQTDPDPDDTSGYDTIKTIKKVLDDSTINKDGFYGLTRTLIVDDSITKVRFNDIDNVLVLPSYDGSDDDIMTVLDGIDDKFKVLMS